MDAIILYASKHGFTKKAAERLGQEFSGKVTLVDVEKESVPDLNPFETIIIGGSIYVGKIQPKVADVCSKYQDLIQAKRYGLFLCCGMQEQADLQLKQAFGDNLYSGAHAKGYFGYEYDFKKMSLFSRLAVKTIAKVKESQSLLLNDNIQAFAKQMMDS